MENKVPTHIQLSETKYISSFPPSNTRCQLQDMKIEY